MYDNIRFSDFTLKLLNPSKTYKNLENYLKSKSGDGKRVAFKKEDMIIDSSKFDIFDQVEFTQVFLNKTVTQHIKEYEKYITNIEYYQNKTKEDYDKELLEIYKNKFIFEKEKVSNLRTIDNMAKEYIYTNCIIIRELEGLDINRPTISSKEESGSLRLNNWYMYYADGKIAQYAPMGYPYTVVFEYDISNGVIFFNMDIGSVYSQIDPNKLIASPADIRTYVMRFTENYYIALVKSLKIGIEENIMNEVFIAKNSKPIGVKYQIDDEENYDKYKKEIYNYLKANKFYKTPYEMKKSGSIREELDMSLVPIPDKWIKLNTGVVNEDYIRIRTDELDLISFFNESVDNTKSPMLKKLLYDSRIKNNKEILSYYKEFKSRNPQIKKTYVDLKQYSGANLFVDLSKYLNAFDINNFYKLDKGLDLYFDLINRLISKNRLIDNGYSKFTVIIPVDSGIWDVKEDSYIWDYRKNINPISLIDRMVREDPERLKKEWKDYMFLFTSQYGYFAIDFDKFTSDDLVRFRSNIRTLQNKETIEDDTPNTVESPKAMVANIVDKIERSHNISINNIAGSRTGVTSNTIKNTEDKEEDKTIVDKEKDELVDKITDIANDPTISNSDQVIDALEDDPDIKKILDDLASEEDNKVKMNAARASRMTKIDDEFKTKKVKDKTVRELLDEKPLEGELPKTSLDIDTVNDEWKELQFVNFNKVYDLDRDIVKVIHSFSEMSVPIGIRNIDVENTSTSEDYIDTYTVQCEDSFGQRFTLKFDVPKIKDDRFMRLRGNDKVMSGQLVLLPVIKTDDDTVQIVSNYKKIFVRRYGTLPGKSYPTADRIIKTVKQMDNDKSIKITTGDNSRVCAKYELPIDYIDLAGVYTRIETNGYIIYFNQDEIRSKYKIDDSKGVPIGIIKSDNSILYFNHTEGTCSDVIMAIISVDNKNFEKIYNTTKFGNKYTYSKASILNTEIPIVVMMGYNIGLLETMKKANIRYTMSEKKHPGAIYDHIKFNDGYISYELNYTSSMLMNGLKDCDTANYSLSEINNTSMWLDFLDGFGGRIKADGLDNFYDLMIDVITKEICQRYQLPDNYIDILVYANMLLADNKYNKHTDITGNRFRTNEIIAGYTYRCLAMSYGDYRNQIKRNRKGSTMTIKRSAVIDAILLDNTESDQSKLTPLLEYEAASSVSFKGLSGMNSDRAYNLDKRTYDESMINVLSLSTGFSANAGINRQTTIDMNIEGERGYIKTTTNLDDMSVTKTLSMTEALTPFGTTHDDPIRSAMTFVQTSKHGMRTKVSHPSLITNGADEALPYLTSDTFSFKAKQNGVVSEKTDTYMIVTYDDGTSEYVDLGEQVMKNSDGGFYLTLQLDTNLEVGDKFKATNILAYDTLSYSDIAGPTDNISYTGSVLCKVAIMNTHEGYEDSSIISEWLSNAMSSDVVVKKDLVLPKNTNVYYMATKGQPVQEGDSLMIFQNAFDEDDMNALLKALGDDEQEITDLARIPIKSKVTGVVQDINIYRTVEKEELSESLRKVVDKYEKDIRSMKSVMKKYDIESADKLQPDYKLDATGKLKNALDSVLIEFYLKYEDKMSIGDKLVYYSALKGVVKDIFPEGKEPTSTFRPDEKLDALLAIGSVNGRMVTSINPVAGINKVLIELDRQVKDIMGKPFKYINER